ncbi:MAG: hypothetical protein AB7P69_24490, partial [Candidatus Binatia bacterium]
GGNRGGRSEGFLRNGAARNGSWQASRPQIQGNGQFSPQQFQSRQQAGDAASQVNRQNTTQQLQTRQQTGDAASQTSRQNTAKDLQARQQAGDAANREDWQSHANQDREDRQNYRTETREDWQDYDESHGGYYGGYYRGYGYPAYPAGGVAAGMAIGSTMTAAAFNQQKASCTTLIVNGMTYYQCGSTWYQPSSQGSNVTYIVVSPPK